MKTTLSAKALLLDMDGTLVQSTDSVEAVWSYWCDDRSVPLRQVLDICHGVRAADVVRAVAPHLVLEEEIRALEELEMKHSSGTAMPGASSFLHSLGDFPWALVTSASSQVARYRMDSCGLRMPGVLVCSEDTVRGKPNPEPYLAAARKLGVETSDCIVFEDAVAGLESALAAGCKAIQIGGKDSLHDSVAMIVQDWHQVRVDRAEADGIRLSLDQNRPV